MATIFHNNGKMEQVACSKLYAVLEAEYGTVLCGKPYVLGGARQYIVTQDDELVATVIF